MNPSISLGSTPQLARTSRPNFDDGIVFSGRRSDPAAANEMAMIGRNERTRPNLTLKT